MRGIVAHLVKRQVKVPALLGVVRNGMDGKLVVQRLVYRLWIDAEERQIGHLSQMGQNFTAVVGNAAAGGRQGTKIG